MKIPDNAKTVFEGVIFKVHHWEQELYDGSIATFEMLSRTASTDAIMVTADKKIIVLLQEQPNKPEFYSFAGGRMEEGEKPIDAIKREMVEETGYDSDNITLFKEYFGYPKLLFHESLFIAKNCKKISGQNLDAGEKIKILFMDFDEFLQLCRKPNLTCAADFKLYMYEALINEEVKEELRKALFD